MKKLSFVLMAITVMASCKKETSSATETPAPTPLTVKFVSKIVSVYDNQAPETESLTFDAKGNNTVYNNGYITGTFNYISPVSLIVTEKKNEDNSAQGTKECELDAKGRVVRMALKNPAGAVFYSYEFAYNEEGFITRKTGSIAGVIDYEILYTIESGNVTVAKLYRNGILNHTTTYGYDMRKTNTMPCWQGYWQSYSLFGKPVKNMITGSRQVSAAGSVVYDIKSSFEFDALGYPVKETRIDNITGILSTYDFEY